MGGRTVSVETPYMLPARGKKRGRKRKPGRRGKGGAGVYPALKNVGVNHGVTPALCEDVTLSALNNTFDEASDSLKRRGIGISPKRVRAVSEKFAASALEIRGKDLDDYHNGVAAVAPVLQDARVAVCLDGGRINIRTPKNGRIPDDAKRRGFNANWREPKLFTIYSLDDEGKRRKGSPRFCDGTISGPEKTLDLLAAQLHRLGIGGANLLAGWLNDSYGASALNPAGYQPMMLYFFISGALGFGFAMMLWLTAGRSRHEAVTHAR